MNTICLNRFQNTHRHSAAGRARHGGSESIFSIPGHIFISRVSILETDGGSQEILLVISIIPAEIRLVKALGTGQIVTWSCCVTCGSCPRVEDKLKPSTGHCLCLFYIWKLEKFFH